MMAATAWRCWKIPSVGLRFFNVYGPRQNPRGPYGSVVAKFCRNTIRRERPQVFGDGLQTRDYVFVGDLVPVVLWAAETPEAFGRVLNVASGRALSIKDLLEVLGRLGTPMEPQFLPARPGDIRHSWADVSALRQLGAPAPKLALEEGLARTLEFFREARDGEDRQRELP